MVKPETPQSKLGPEKAQLVPASNSTRLTALVAEEAGVLERQEEALADQARMRLPVATAVEGLTTSTDWAPLPFAATVISQLCALVVAAAALPLNRQTPSQVEEGEGE